MSYGWMGNYGDRAKARFIQADSQPEIVWPSRAFVPDSCGGSGTDCLGTRHDVLAQENPSWAADVLAAAVATKMPLRAQRVGSAGKYRFWRLCASSPAAAVAEGEKMAAEYEARLAANRVAMLVEYHARPAGSVLVLADGTIVSATAIHFSGDAMVVAGEIQKIPAGAALQDEGGLEIGVAYADRTQPAEWLPGVLAGPDHPYADWWSDKFRRAESARIASRREKKAADVVAEPAPMGALAAAFAAATRE